MYKEIAHGGTKLKFQQSYNFIFEEIIFQTNLSQKFLHICAKNLSIFKNSWVSQIFLLILANNGHFSKGNFKKPIKPFLHTVFPSQLKFFHRYFCKLKGQ